MEELEKQAQAASAAYIKERENQKAAYDRKRGIAPPPNPAQGEDDDMPAAGQPGGLLKVDQPKLFKGHLKSYQLKGLQWLANLHDCGINGILADEVSATQRERHTHPERESDTHTHHTSAAASFDTGFPSPECSDVLRWDSYLNSLSLTLTPFL